ncbi:pentapeptide repeat-containing protein [Tahibacter harae]|uniref:Pentapeptide repeat-containing protein n=1 Tax=Tahibacter harae TaxID=2963937 RepID=A0ABT1QTE2_9GAMM|nr:pentapeptide repeat-containing protein [Tahibacter harae]MCQ4165560.1 pentapeptide repeat-containing protein [Tahibacter harae]
MNRFYGKYRFIINGRKLVFWENRIGLISKDRTTIREMGRNHVPLPPECCMFLVVGPGDGTCWLQACNGETFASNEGALGILTTTPTGLPRYLTRVTGMRFDLASLRAGSTGKLRYYREDRPGIWADIGYQRARALEVDDITETPYITNVASTDLAGSDWTLEQLGDGIDQMTAGSKKVTHFDFTPAGKAVVNLSGENLAGVDFGRADLSECLLTGATLTNTTFDGARLRKAGLDRANFSGATLNNVIFSKASMNSTNLNGVKGVGCDFSDCDLLSVICAGQLGLTSPENAPMRFSRAKFNYALIGTDWKHRIMDWAEIRAISSGARIDATKANLTGVVLSDLNLASSCKFDNAILRNASLAESRMPFASFKGAFLDGTVAPDLAGTDFAGARLQGSSFEDAHCTRANFSGARLDEANFSKARLHKANFTNAYLRRVNFSAVEQRGMSGASFNRAFLVGCNFSGADLSTYQTDTVNMTQAYLHGADFSGANLAGTLMTGAGIAFEEGSLSVRIDSETANPVPYEATLIDPEDTTTRETSCPNGDKGPCSLGQMHSKQPFPTVWPWPRGASDPEQEVEEVRQAD